jgi:putative tryptophan/tyrosine transport system substrate-binding protein
MILRSLTLALLLGLLAVLAADAQTTGKVSRLGILTDVPSTEIEQELRILGYVEGKNILITRRYTQGNLGVARRLAKEIVDFRPDVVLVSNGEMAGAVRSASPATFIVVAASSDLVAQGLVASLARPDGNVTGLQIMSGDLAGKRLELLREIVPRLARLAVLVPSRNKTGFVSERRQTEMAARTLGVQSDVLWVGERNDVYEAFKKATSSRYDGLFVFSNPFTYSERREIARLAAANGLPAIYETQGFVVAGGLISYGPNISALLRRAVAYVDKILKGAKPADLPVEQPTKFELVINLKTAKALGLTIPQTLLLRADQIIE